MLALCKLPFSIDDVGLAFKGASITIDTKLSDVGLREGDCIDVTVNGAMRKGIQEVMEADGEVVADLCTTPHINERTFLANELAAITVLILQFGCSLPPS